MKIIYYEIIFITEIMKDRKRNRMKGFDYSSNNIYFVTICVKNRLCCFGSVGTGRDLSAHHNHSDKNQLEIKINLNKYGLIVEKKIIWLEEQYSYVEIHNYVIMPNHIHVILEINNIRIKNLDIKIKSLSSIIGVLKTTSSKAIHLNGFEDFSWQRSFHDHIIRNEKAYVNIDNYINLNPEKWHQDTFFIAT